jgi:transcription termination factor NusB
MKVVETIEQIRGMIEKDDFQPSRIEKVKSAYQDLSHDEKPLFFQELIRRVETSRDQVEDLLKDALAAEEGDPLWNKVLANLRTKSESPRMKFFRQFINISEGLKFLLNVRMDLLAIQRREEFDFAPLDQDLAYLINSWFQSGFLVLQEITLDSSYTQINYIKSNDMVHPMTSLEEMGNRLGHDRRCFALYHRAMPDEPVVFIEIALTKGISKSIHQIIIEEAGWREDIERFDSAIFYSINNTQEGLAGIGVGKMLIFQVVDYLKRSVPQVQTFSTLSPIPGFWNNYLKRILEDKDIGLQMKTDKIIETFSQKAKSALTREFHSQTESREEDFARILLGILSDSNWIDNPIYVKYLEKPLTELTYFYISQEKNRKGKPLNPVANFHMANGATVSKKNVNFLGNRSPRGLEESCGMMVNYIYSQNWFQQIRRSFQSFLGLVG